jgi:hypothetical protein
MKPKSKPKPTQTSRAVGASRPPPDLAFVQGPTEDGQGARVVRLRDGVLSAGELRPAREGEPLHAREVVRVRPLPIAAPVCELEVLYDGAASGEKHPAPAAAEHAGPARAAQGPARVASESYRRNWSAVFGSSRRKRDDYSVN